MAVKKQSKRTKRVNHSLSRYQGMRDFSVTAEPRGEDDNRNRVLSREKKLPFVVQKHAATRLHYDFRLGWNGVLKSWAVTKGPSYYPGDKRLAVEVEDHPWEYREFEGTIPKGQYGGGTVMVWDTGDWTPLGDVDQGLKDGHLKFELHGKKLKGNWALVRMHGVAEGSGKTNWLLIKEKDRFARDSRDEAITEEEPDSAVSNRTMEEIAAKADRVWNSAGRGTRESRKNAADGSKGEALAVGQRGLAHANRAPVIRGAPRERFPGFVSPQLAQQASSPPSGDDWVHELKLDGYRIQIQIRSGGRSRVNARSVRLLTRKGIDWTACMPDIAAAAGKLNVKNAILDGEAVALDKRGVSNFADLQAAFQERGERYITYFAFDLLHFDGRNIRALPLTERKRILSRLLDSTGEDSPLRLSEDLTADGAEVLRKACDLGAEGIVSKLASAQYTSGRSGAWLKLKCHIEQEFVIGGFTLPSKGTVGIGALMLGYYEDGKLLYAGRSGTGFTQATHRMLRAKLERLARKDSPFVEVPRKMRRGAHWVKPDLVAQIAFSTWTRDKFVRQAAFKGLREDKPAMEVVRESVDTAKEAKLSVSRQGGKASAQSLRGSGGATPIKDLAITHPDKVLDTESGMTKRQLAEYFSEVAEHLLPHIADRPLSVVRCPNGTSKSCFFQKHVGPGLPSGVKSVSIRDRKSQRKEDYLTVDSTKGLIGLAQMGVLEIHPWGSHNDSLEKPDRIVFDLDPDLTIKWKTLADAAHEFNRRLATIGLESFVKSTGGKGLHIVVPIRPDRDWPAIKKFAFGFVLELERENPELYVTKMAKATRKNRIYLDYLRNDRGATSVAPYSPRAKSGAPVAMPLRWSELNVPKPPTFHVSDLTKWKARLRHDPWVEMLRMKQEIPSTETN
jgi:bifunctional non-homologous end joining protein LigD